MGKSVGFLGPISGRVGNTVGYVLKDASKQTQGWRVYQPNVGNPQTDAQMQQRIRLTAINNQYRALKEIISRGFEGLNYGNVSRRKYLSMAMGQRFEGPWLTKDDKRPVPVLQVPITVGSLPQVVCTRNDEYNAFLTNIPVASGASAFSNVGDLSDCFIEAGFYEGDQVTFIYATYGDGGAVLIRWESIYIASGNADPLPPIMNAALDEHDFVQLNYGDNIHGLAIAISRDGDGSHLRSTSYWAINEDLEGPFYADNAYRQNSPSYIRRRSASTNWELDTDVEGGGGGGGGGSVQLAYTISGTEIEPQSLSPYSAQNPIQIVGGNGSKYFILTRSGSSQAYINGAGTTVDSVDGGTNANTVDVYSERNKAQNLRGWLIAQGIQASVLPAYT